MLTAKEKRFIKYWEEQRKGGRWPYFLLYIPAGTIIATISISFLILMVVIGGIDYVPYIAAAAFVMVIGITTATWHNNEKKFKEIIRREVDHARLLDQEENGGNEENL